MEVCVVTGRGGLVSLVLLVLLGAVLAGGCTSSDEQRLVGSWRTELTGYNTVAGSVTKYEQKITFGEDGKFALQATLPAMVDVVTGTWELDKVEGSPVIRITWEGTSTVPSEFKYDLQGDHLLTSRLKGGMPKPEQLNVTEVDPVEYVRR